MQNEVTSDAEQAAEEAGLRYVTDAEPGIRRRRRGRGFSYHAPDGSLINGSTKGRINSLVIPPAWEDVWICLDRAGHLQATGRDYRGPGRCGHTRPVHPSNTALHVLERGKPC